MEKRLNMMKKKKNNGGIKSDGIKLTIKKCSGNCSSFNSSEANEVFISIL